MKHYVLGFAFFEDKVALIFKTHGPAPVIGKLNGIGGHMEAGESPAEAMSREFDEECGVSIAPNRWVRRGTMQITGYDAIVHLFSYRSPIHFTLRQMTDERVSWQPIKDIPAINTVSNLRWLVPFAYDSDQLSAIFVDTTPGK